MKNKSSLIKKCFQHFNPLSPLKENFYFISKYAHNLRAISYMIKKVSAAVITLVVLVSFAGCASSREQNGPLVGHDSVISTGSEWVYYNDTNKNIVCKNLENGDVTVFSESITLLASDDNSVLATDGSNLILFDNSGNVTDTVEGITAEAAYLSDDAIYYKDTISGYVVKIDIATKNSEYALPIAIDRFKVYSNKVVFTTAANNMIYFYDMETGLPQGYFGDKNIGDFAVDGEELVYSDLNDDGNVHKMNLSTGEENVFEGVKSAKFTYRNGVLYYIENVDGSEEEYKLKNTEG